MPIKIPLRATKNWFKERIPLLGMSDPQMDREEAGLRARIAECKRHQQTIISRIAEMKREGGKDVDVRIIDYLGDKTFDEWMMLYDTLIYEAEQELEALGAVPDLEDARQARKALLLASGVTAGFFLVLALFFLPEPISAFTGNVVGAARGEPLDLDIFFGTFAFLAVIFTLSYAVARSRL